MVNKGTLWGDVGESGDFSNTDHLAIKSSIRGYRA